MNVATPSDVLAPDDAPPSRSPGGFVQGSGGGGPAAIVVVAARRTAATGGRARFSLLRSP